MHRQHSTRSWARSIDRRRALDAAFTQTASQDPGRVGTIPQRRTALLPALKIAQYEVGWLPPEAIAEVADLVGVSHAAALELATFYSMLQRRAAGGQQGRGVRPVAVRAARRRSADQDLADGLGIAPGRSTDGDVDVERTSECFGACHSAPMARLNDEYRENLTPSAQR